VEIELNKNPLSRSLLKSEIAKKSKKKERWGRKNLFHNTDDFALIKKNKKKLSLWVSLPLTRRQSLSRHYFASLSPPSLLQAGRGESEREKKPKK